MRIDSKNYCDNKKCPLHSDTDVEFIRLSSTYIKVTIAQNEELAVAVPCLLCKHAKKIDMGHVMAKIATKQMLNSGDISADNVSFKDDIINAN
jgi:hypothetical protein